MSDRDLYLLSLDNNKVQELLLFAIFKQLIKIIDSNVSPKLCKYFDIIEKVLID